MSIPDPLDAWRNGILSRSAQETERLAAELAARFPPDATLALHGDLGAGKTTFVRGLARAWGIAGPVTSPTYAIFNLHRGGTRRLVHLDAYRLARPEDTDHLMLWDLLESPWALVVEWPSKLGDRLPPDAWHLHLAIVAPGEHRLRLTLPENK